MTTKRLASYLLMALMLLGATLVNATPTPTICHNYIWTPPTTDVRGNPMTLDGGYRLYEKHVDGSYTHILDINDPMQTVIPIISVFPADGTYTAAITAFMLSGDESTYSDGPVITIFNGEALAHGIPSAPSTFQMECTILTP